MIKKVHMAGRILIASFFITGTILAYADKIKSHIRQSFIDEALSYSRERMPEPHAAWLAHQKEKVLEGNLVPGIAPLKKRF